MATPPKTKKIKFEGQTYDFPDDATDDEINQVLGGTQPAAPVAPTPAQPEARSYTDELQRQAALAGRYMIEGPAQFASILGNAANSVTNAGISGINKIAGTNIKPIMRMSDAISPALDAVGFPKPENATERIVGEGSKFLASVGPVAGAAKVAGELGVRGLEPLTQGMLSQGIGSIGGGLSYGTAKELAPDSPAIQVAAALLGGGLTSGAATKLGGTTADAAIPTIESIRGTSSAAYKAAEDAGAIIKPEAIQRLTQATQNQLAELGVDATLHPKTLAAFKRLADASSENITLKGLETIRRVAGEAAKSNEPSEQMMASQIIRNIDDLVENLKPADLVQGNSTQAVSALLKARQLWKQASKAERIQNAIDDAKLRAATSGSGGNLDNAIRQEFAKIVKSDKLSRGFTKDELKAIESVAKGTFTQNTLRTFGKISPQGNGLMNYLGIGGLLSGGAFSVPPIIGLAAKPAAEAMTRNSASGVLTRVLAGEVPEATKDLSPSIAALLSSIQAGGAEQILPLLRGIRATATEAPDKKPQGKQ